MARKKKKAKEKEAKWAGTVDSQAFRERAVLKNISFARAEDKSTPFWQQADAHLNTDDAKLERNALRDHPAVKMALVPWWNTSKRCGDIPLTHADRLARSDYKGLCIRMYRALIDVWDDEEAFTTAEEDCEEDCRGLSFITREQFVGSLFELADMWSHDIDGDE